MQPLTWVDMYWLRCTMHMNQIVLLLARFCCRYGPRMTFGVSMISLILADLVLMTSGTHPWAVFASLVFMGVSTTGQQAL